jgi:uncharacterized membrane protein
MKVAEPLTVVLTGELRVGGVVGQVAVVVKLTHADGFGVHPVPVASTRH